MQQYHLKLGLVLTAFSCLPTSSVFAHEGIKYDCSSNGVTRIVELFENENRVQINIGNQSYAAVSDKQSGYLNVFEAAQFYPKDNKSRLYLNSKQIECKFYNPNAISDPTTNNDNKPTMLKPIIGRSLGGKVRNGANMQARQIGSLYLNDPIVITANTGVNMNGYDWFEIEYKGGKKGYQWGGIMCTNDPVIAGIYRQCE